MKHSLVTGGAGFIGSHLVEALLARGDQVTVIDDESTGNVANLASVIDHPRLRYVQGSVADASTLNPLLAGQDEVYHLAAAVGVQLIAEKPIHTIETNVYPTGALLSQLARLYEAGQRVRLFLASTSEVYGKNPRPKLAEDDDMHFGPTTRARWSYGASKAIDEFLALAYWHERGLPTVIGRFFNVVGPRQTGAYGMVLPRFIEAALAGKPLEVHDDGQQQRCFAHVKDVIDIVLELTAKPQAVGQVFNIGSDEPVTILELAQRVIAATGSVGSVQFVSYEAAYGKSFEDCRRRVPDLSRLRELIGDRRMRTLHEVIAELVGRD
jgi:UDP-glucose 4-epimerase